MKYRISERHIDPSKLIVVTDLDGTLLDFDDYSFESALPAIAMLRKHKVPIVCCSSKTSAEIRYWRNKLKLLDPFICENGAAVFFPADRFRRLPGKLSIRGRYVVKELGPPKSRIREVFEVVRLETRIGITGFSDMKLSTIKSLCGFKTNHEAKIASRREYSEPFVFPAGAQDEASVNLVLNRFAKSGLRVIRGRRFFHLVGVIDKGRAVELMLSMYAATGESRDVTVGLGDGKNDLEMLRTVDFPVLVMGKNRRYDREVRANVRPLLAGAPGPVGWRRAIEKLLAKSGYPQS